MTVSILISIFATLALWLPANNNIAIFYTMVPIFGFGSGSVMSLAPVCIGELCKVSEYGQRYGTSYSVVGLAYVWLDYLQEEMLIRPSELSSRSQLLPSFKQPQGQLPSWRFVVECWCWRCCLL